MQVAILAGGLGTRLKAMTTGVPKSLVMVNGRPFIHWQLDLLRASGVNSVVILIGHLGEQIQHSIGDGSKFGLAVEYSADGAALRGTGGALCRAVTRLDRKFLVLFGDSYLLCDYESLFRAHERGADLATMAVFRNNNVFDSSDAYVRDGRLVGYRKNPPLPGAKYINYGVSAISRELLESFPVNWSGGLQEMLEPAIQTGRAGAVTMKTRFYEIGSVEGLAALSTYLQGQPK